MRLVIRVLGLALLAVFAGYEYPAALGTVIYGVEAHPWPLAAALVLVLLAAAMIRKRGLRRYWRYAAAALLAILVLAVYSEAARSLSMAGSIRVEELERLPAMDPGSVRVVPLAVAHARAEAVFSSATHRPGTHTLLVYREGRPYWQIPVVPERGWNYLSGRMTGYIEIPAYTFHLEPRLVESSFRYGFEHLHDILWAAYVKEGLWGSRVELADSYIAAAEDGSRWIVVPLTSWRLKNILYTVPVVSGAMLVCENGTIRMISASEAASDPLTRRGPLVPEWVARWYVEKLNYRHGLLNTITSHRDMFELRDPSRRNKQPWLIRSSDGRLWWLFAAEPYGRGGGVDRLFLVNAGDPHMKIYEYRVKGGLLIGPRRAADLARASLPSYDWERYAMEEPIPLMINGTLYWRVAVIPRDASTIDSIVLVNSRTGDAAQIKSDEELASLLAGKHMGGGEQGLQELVEKLRRMIAEEERRLVEMKRILEELEKIAANQTGSG